MQYWGARAICDRLGFGSTRRLPQFIERYALPVFPRRKGHRMTKMYYTSESALTAWELANGALYREELKAKRLEREETARQRQRNQEQAEHRPRRTEQVA